MRALPQRLTSTLLRWSNASQTKSKNLVQHFLGALVVAQVHSRCLRLPDADGQAENVLRALDPALFLVGTSAPLPCPRECSKPLGVRQPIYEPHSDVVRRLVAIKGEPLPTDFTTPFLSAPIEQRLSTLAPYSRADNILYRRIINANARVSHDNQYVACPSFILLNYIATPAMLAIYLQNGSLVHYGCKYVGGAIKSTFGAV